MTPTDMQKEGSFLIPGKKGLMDIRGDFASMRLPDSGDRAEDKLDVAYFRLDLECADNLHADFRVLGRQEVLLEAEPPLYTVYTFVGYPWRRCKVKGRNIETDITTSTGVEARSSEYEALGLNRSLHIAIRFHRKRTFSQRIGKVVTSSLPHGMSGGES